MSEGVDSLQTLCVKSHVQDMTIAQRNEFARWIDVQNEADLTKWRELMTEFLCDYSDWVVSSNTSVSFTRASRFVYHCRYYIMPSGMIQLSNAQFSRTNLLPKDVEQLETHLSLENYAGADKVLRAIFETHPYCVEQRKS